MNAHAMNPCMSTPSRGVPRPPPAGASNCLRSSRATVALPLQPAPQRARGAARFSRRAAVCAATLFAAFALAGCAGPQIADYAAQRPMFDFKKYFSGKLIAHGMASDRAGKVQRRFVVTMDCTWVGDMGTLDEHFVYDDGEKQQRIWRVRQLPDGTLTGTADDVVGEARGATAGAAFRWQYTLKLPARGSVYEVQFDDWIHLIDERTALNKAVITKFGVRVGDVLLSFTKL